MTEITGTPVPVELAVSGDLHCSSERYVGADTAYYQLVEVDGKRVALHFHCASPQLVRTMSVWEMRILKAEDAETAEIHVRCDPVVSTTARYDTLCVDEGCLCAKRATRKNIRQRQQPRGRRGRMTETGQPVSA